MSQYLQFPNLGVLEVKLTDNDLLLIRSEVAELQQDFSKGIEHNSKLVGNLAKEYTLSKCTAQINKIVLQYLREYDYYSDYMKSMSVLTNDRPVVIQDSWVNFQSKNEFNPPHNHSGAASFVIWLQIPYNIEDELKSVSCAKSAQPLAGHFAFHYTDILGKIRHYHIPADKNMENTMLIFPASLSHSVCPFYTSDDYRISVSGNIQFLA